IGLGGECLAPRIRRQRGPELRHGAQYGGGEGVAVLSGPDAIVAGMAVAIGRAHRLNLWNERRRRGSVYVDEHARGIAEPASVRRPTVGAHRLAPADHVVAAPAAGVFGLEHDPAVDGENALPATGAA